MLDVIQEMVIWGMSHIEVKLFSLIKHDFNKPQKDKDQRDWESAVAQHCRTVYINAGHNIQTAEDIKNSSLHMNGVKNAKVSIVEIDSSVNETKSQIIDNISNYHSAEFEDNKNCFWNYYSVGKGIVAEKKCVEFTSGLNVVYRFEKIGSNYNSKPWEHKKNPTLDHMRKENILYCPISDCVKTFLSEAASENHMLLNNHSFNLTGLDQVKQIYINHVINSSELNCSFQDNLTVNTESNNTFIMG